MPITKIENVEYRPRAVFQELASVKPLSEQTIRKKFSAAIRNDDTLLKEIVSRNINKFDDIVSALIGKFEGSEENCEVLLAAIRCDDALFDAVISEEFECLYDELED
jgi:hypothetical protein